MGLWSSLYTVTHLGLHETEIASGSAVWLCRHHTIRTNRKSMHIDICKYLSYRFNTIIYFRRQILDRPTPWWLIQPFTWSSPTRIAFVTWSAFICSPSLERICHIDKLYYKRLLDTKILLIAFWTWLNLSRYVYQ